MEDLYQKLNITSLPWLGWQLRYPFISKFKFTKVITQVVASRSMVRNAARALDSKHPDTVQLCSMAKLFATDNCFEVKAHLIFVFS